MHSSAKVFTHSEIQTTERVQDARKPHHLSAKTGRCPPLHQVPLNLGRRNTVDVEMQAFLFPYTVFDGLELAMDVFTKR